MMQPVPPRDLLLASQNPGKLNEMRLLVEGLPFRVLGPRDLGIEASPEETGETYLENAILKARHYARLSGLLTVADDSGLSVDALDGRPRPPLEPLRRRGRYRCGSQPAAAPEARGRAAPGAGRPLHERRGRGAGRRRALHDGAVGRGPDRRGAAGNERLRLRPALLLPAVRHHVRRGVTRGQGQGESSRPGLRALARVPGHAVEADKARNRRDDEDADEAVAELDRENGQEQEP